MRKATSPKEAPHFKAAPEKIVHNCGWDNPTSKKGGM
jgi:hypothetical protein